MKKEKLSTYAAQPGAKPPFGCAKAQAVTFHALPTVLPSRLFPCLWPQAIQPNPATFHLATGHSHPQPLLVRACDHRPYRTAAQPQHTTPRLYALPDALAGLLLAGGRWYPQRPGARSPQRIVPKAQRTLPSDRKLTTGRRGTLPAFRPLPNACPDRG